MKKIIIVAIISILTVTSYKYLNDPMTKNYQIKKVLTSLNVFDNMFAGKNSEIKVSAMLTKSIEIAPSIEDLESEFKNKSTREIEEAIKENNKVEAKFQFIAKANANQLDQELTDKFVKYIRINSTLNKILMERELDNNDKEGV